MTNSEMMCAVAWEIHPQFAEMSDGALVAHFRCEFGLSPEAVREKHCRAYLCDHPLFPLAFWKAEVANDNVISGYWNWVVAQIEDVFWDYMPRASPEDAHLYKIQDPIPGMLKPD